MKKQCPQAVETKRLLGLIPSLNDLDDYYCMMQNKQFVDCYGVAFNKEELYKRVISDINHWQQYGFGMWLWRDKENKDFVGRAGLKYFLLDNKNEVELGYAIRPEYWGKSIAVEMSLMAIELAFNRLSLPELICFTSFQNYQSLRVMQKLGFGYEKDFVYLDIPHKLHRLSTVNLVL
ncbi:GNAT family N-acetyltransferase [Rickettsiella endosymbiont of Dermanyssus gallinae]|uniref:GNAT family N-acetyltransferase n=1 Tax=Rickettsiella endosymbiont of Dermanyssus gallinae TaxID=2856608 RepID=UPI001C530CCB|nr:GNAT family N-acetyltransferase [Rickettsiella endosymbiont of Dermanyssus gallinae]